MLGASRVKERKRRRRRTGVGFDGWRNEQIVLEKDVHRKRKERENDGLTSFGLVSFDNCELARRL